MVYMLEKLFHNADFDVDLTSFIDNKQNVWFKGKDVALILGHSNTRDAIKRHVSENHEIRQLSWQRRETRRWSEGKKQCSGQPVSQTGWSETYFIYEAGFYKLVFGSKLETAKKFRDWVFTQVLPSIRKYGQYKLFDNPNNHMFKIENELDIHTKVVEFIWRFYPECILVAPLGENQDASCKTINSWKQGYNKGSPDLLLMNYHKDYTGCCIEFKSPSNNYQIAEKQKEMNKRYKENGYYFTLSNDYDLIIQYLNEYMQGIWVPCKYCEKSFLSKETRKTHYKIIHRIEK